MRGAALVAGLLLAAAASSVAADKDWNAWYWSDFDADAGEGSVRERDTRSGSQL